MAEAWCKMTDEDGNVTFAKIEPGSLVYVTMGINTEPVVMLTFVEYARLAGARDMLELLHMLSGKAGE